MKQYFFIAALAILTCLPARTDAYFTTEQSARAISESLGIYSLSFNLSHPSLDIYVPSEVARSSVAADKIGYDLMAASETVSDFGNLYGVLIGDVDETEDGYYYIPAGRVGSFTLYTIFVHDYDPEIIAEDDYAMKMTHLPFYFGEERAKNGLNPSELDKYLTPELDLDESFIGDGPAQTQTMQLNR